MATFIWLAQALDYYPFRDSQSRNLRFIAPAQESQGNLAAALTSWTASRDLAIEIHYEPFQTSAQEEIDSLSERLR